MKSIQKVGIISGLIIGLLGAFWGVVNLIPMPKVCESNPWMKEDKALISAHRGGAFLNPENTKKLLIMLLKKLLILILLRLIFIPQKMGLLLLTMMIQVTGWP